MASREGRLLGRSVLVTGAASGIGAAVAELFHAEGATVTLTDVADDPGEALASRLGDRATYRHLDVTSEAGWASVVDELTASGAWTTLVTSAGAALRSPLADTSVEDVRRVLDLNVVGTFLGLRAAARSMTAGGSVVTIASLRGLEATAELGAYGASKAAVTLMSRVAALEVAGKGIRVNTICPGSIATPITDRPDFDGTDWDAYVRSIPLARRGTAAEVAQAALFLASADSAYVTGTELVIDGGTAAGRTTPVAG